VEAVQFLVRQQEQAVQVEVVRVQHLEMEQTELPTQGVAVVVAMPILVVLVALVLLFCQFQQ
jgi:hypothetical protein